MYITLLFDHAAGEDASDDELATRFVRDRDALLNAIKRQHHQSLT